MQTPAFYPPVDTTIRWPIPPQVYYEQVNVGDEIILNPPAEFQGGPGGGGPFGG